MGTFTGKGMADSWQEGDVILLRSPLPEADFLKTDVPTENRAAVERHLVAPLTTLYPDRVRKPVIPLTMSHYRDDKVRTTLGHLSDPRKYYDDELAAELRKYKRYWMTGLAPNQAVNTPYFMACFLPWLADTLGTDLMLSRNRGERGDPERYVEVPTHVRAGDFIEGLTGNVRPTDYVFHAHLARPKQPAGVFTLGAIGLLPGPNAHVAVPAFLGSEYPTPRHTTNPEETAATNEAE
jgi:hypothetical protein